MFVPIHDANDLRHIRLQFVTLGLIGLNVAVWFLTALDGLVPWAETGMRQTSR